MTGHDERIESLMNRSLDGDLSEAEQLELDRTLIRSPDVRREYERMQRIDRLAAEGLRVIVPWDEMTPVPAPDTGVRGPRSRTRKLWWAVPAVAAAAGLVVLALLNFRGAANRSDRDVAAANDNAGAVLRVSQDGNRPLQPVVPGSRPHLTDRAMDRNWIGIEGDDGRIYWIETDRVRTLERSRDAGKVKLVSDDL
jgi:anti-sigma factor RsiW